MVQEGCIGPLVALACCDDLDAARAALTALRSVAISVENREKIVAEGVLDPLVRFQLVSGAVCVCVCVCVRVRARACACVRQGVVPNVEDPLYFYLLCCYCITSA